MNSVKVRKIELLGKVMANRETHRDDFLKAQTKYREMIITELDRMLESARKGEKINRYIQLPEPQDCTKLYDREILMLEMSVDNEITLSANEFSCFVLDEWEWAKASKTTNAFYVGH